MHFTLLLPFRKVLLITASFILLCALLVSPAAQAQSSGSKQRDCDANAVLRCGAYTTAEVKQKYDSQAGAKTIFSHFGISSTEVSSMHTTAVSGFVTKGGRVLVKDQTVATNAQTAGRQNMPGSKAVTQNGTTFYTRAPSVSFSQDKLDAYVVMKNGQFQYAVIKSCGNPVKATPVEKPKPTPAPAAAKPVVTPLPVTPVQQSPAPAPAPKPPQSQPAQVQIVQTKQVVEVAAPAPAPAPAAPVVLPKTGPGEVIGASAAVSMASTFGYGLYAFLRRRYGMG